MIKLILFDLDGVITDTKEVHYDALNKALVQLNPKYKITEEEHIARYDGLKTKTKLAMLSEEKGLPYGKHEQVYDLKQKITLDSFLDIEADKRMQKIFQSLREKGYSLGCCTNAIRRSAICALAKIGVIEYLDVIVSNDDIKSPKPHPEIYWKAMSALGVFPEETIVIEDSPQGLLSANRSGAHVLRVKNPSDVSLSKILNKTKYNMTPKNTWSDEKMNVLIPMAGAGSRFEKAGYSFPKPLIDVKGKPMIQAVSESLNFEARFIYIVRKSHREKYNLDTLLNMISPNCKIVEVEGVTEGAACTTLLAKELINNKNPLIIANSDQFIKWDSTEFMYKMDSGKYDGGVLCFPSTHPKWSFAKSDEAGIITEVAEKNPISNHATVGVYYWAKGSDYVKFTEKMIEKNVRVNNEFYVCPVFNEAIEEGKKIFNFQIPADNMWGLGTPEDLKYFIDNYKE